MSQPPRSPASPPRRPRTSRPTAAPAPGGARVRRGAVRVSADVAWRLGAGDPWIFRDAHGWRPMREAAADLIDVLDDTGAFVARGIYDPQSPIAIRVFARSPDTVLDAATIEKRVQRARRLREALLDPQLDAHRIIHGEGDGLPGL